jgi:hypothetical protein
MFFLLLFGAEPCLPLVKNANKSWILLDLSDIPIFLRKWEMLTKYKGSELVTSTALNFKGHRPKVIIIKLCCRISTNV